MENKFSEKTDPKKNSKKENFPRLKNFFTNFLIKK